MALVETKLCITDNKSNDLFFESFSENQNCIICKSPDKLKAVVSAIQPNMHTHFVSDGDWSMHDLLNELLNVFQPATIYIATYAIREFAARQLVKGLLNGSIAAVHILLDARAKCRTPEVYELVKQNCCSIFLTEVHAKVLVVESSKGTITVVGSANFTSNPRIETGVITSNKAVANFHIQWLKKVISHAKIFS